MAGKNLKRVAATENGFEPATVLRPEAGSFVAGGTVGELHQRLQQELGMDWDDPIVYAPSDAPIAQRVERKFSALVGVAALGAGYGLAAKLIF
ncbi:hypothetical protein E3U23_07745 [Erythrobacter litoralis]|uniref:hypothetical protein n=1 Tax=Erythrobacter litoralis TaxID=39960 RepID=UPI0024350D89|nr:hypothetical protein [Erythrobacter litoralis]MDG6079082.1 hypothetical protein [Erythrobacter litoralis]